MERCGAHTDLAPTGVLAVQGIPPATREVLTGGEAQLLLGEMVRILKLLSAMDAAGHDRRKGIAELAQIKDLHEAVVVVARIAVLMQGEEHGSRPAVGKP